MVPMTVTAQTPADLKNQLLLKLENGQNDEALLLTEALYETSIKVNDRSQSGYAAYAKAQIYSLQNLTLEAAKAYEQCGKEYAKAGSAAQSLQCQYQSGLAFSDAGKDASAVDVLESAAKELEKIGQAKSALAANTYATLAKVMLPSKLESRQGAKNKRLATIEYAEKAMRALEATGQDNTLLYTSMSFQKGVAYEHMQDYEAAKSAYKNTLKLTKSRPDTPEDFQQFLETRYSIVNYQTKDKADRERLPAFDRAGNEIELEWKKKRRVQIPRIDNSSYVDGASATIRITLDAEGKVSDVIVLESAPNEKYGEALSKAAKKWAFTPPEGLSGLDVAPFEYGMTFSVRRR
jgi:TonB family protein